MIAPRTFLYRHDAATGVAIVTLNRPERMNALTFDAYDEMRAFFAAVGEDSAVRAIVITGTGSAFCTGGDVHDIIGRLLDRSEAELLEFTRATGDLVRAIRACPRPVIAALNGPAAGAGAVIAAASDLRIAAESARIAFLFVKVGLSGADMGTAWILPRLVGAGRAMELLMTGDFIDAAEAYRIGLYNRVVPDGTAADAARLVAEQLARGPLHAIAATKGALDREACMDFAAALEWEAQAQAILMTQADFREAYEAFVEKRPPRFS